MTDAERRRLSEDRLGIAPWRRWGPYVSLRQWGTVREDYSENGTAWEYFPFDHARSRAYRWGEDGLAAICDRWQHLCLGLALWNGHDPILKERLFGLANEEGNHGEDVKELWWPVDGLPTHAWHRWCYRYPQRRFPYEQLREENARRSRSEPEFELADTGIFDDSRFFDVELVMAKVSPNDLCLRYDITNHGPESAPLHVLPQAWFRNTWAWGRDDRYPSLSVIDDHTVLARHDTLGRFQIAFDPDVAMAGDGLLFTDNETNSERLWGWPSRTPYVKDGFHDHVISGAATVNPERRGTKAAAWYRLEIAPGATASIRVRVRPDLADLPEPNAFGAGFGEVFALRQREADDFHAALAGDEMPAAESAVMRRAVAGLLATKQYYHFHVEEWLEGDPAHPPPPEGRRTRRNAGWTHLANTDIVSMPDGWEYPWYAAWDLAFHMIPMAFIDPDFAKEQLLLLCREWYMHPNGQLPAYEWALGDVNPPVHAWAAWRVYKIDARNSGIADHDFLQRAFHKLLLNFTWWVNRKDTEGRNVFEGGFLGLDNISLFDRSNALPAGGQLHQVDATAWMGMFCLNMLAMALELARADRAYEDVATKFFEHFLAIANALNSAGPSGVSLWDDEDGFFYDVLSIPGRPPIPLKVRTIVGIIPLFAVETIEPEVLEALPEFAARMRWLIRHRPRLCGNVFDLDLPGRGQRRMLSLIGPERLRLILSRTLAEERFLSPYGVRSLSKAHSERPVRVEIDGVVHEITYEPGESTSGTFGGNSNWRGPVWFPINYLLIESLQKFGLYFGDDFMVEMPTGSGRAMDLDGVADELSARLISLFVPGADGRRPLNGGRDLYDHDPLFAQHIHFPEYFHGDTGAGLGASHQTGWTALVAKLIRQQSRPRNAPGISAEPFRSYRNER